MYITISAAVFGLCLGSFANVVIMRVPKGESIIKPPSHCPRCSTRLRAKDLIPVLSWLMLLGKCRYCRGRISIRYPVAEFMCAVLFAGMSVYAGRSFSIIPLCLLSFVLLCVSFTDIDTQEIPDGLIVFGVITAGIWLVAQRFWDVGAPVLHNALLGALCGAVPLLVIDGLTLLIAKKDGFGFGDVKLMGMTGLFLGWRLTLTALYLSVIAGGVYGAYLIVTRRIQRGGYIAFGPFLAGGSVAALWFGEMLLRAAGF